MLNISLKSDVKDLLLHSKNIMNIKKGIVSNFSIEIELKEPEAHSSYIYYDKEISRNLDFVELEKLVFGK